MANEYLKRTPTSSGNRKVFTWSGWVKKQQFAYEMIAFSGPTTVTTGLVMFGWGNTTGLYLNFYSGSVSRVYEVDEEYRDFGSWLHYQISVDTTQTTEDDRINFYINGVQRSLSVVSGYSALPQNYLLDNMTAGKETLLGVGRNYYGNFSGYSKLELSDIFFVDGQALTPDVFGFYKDGDGYMSSGTSKATDFRPGQWSPHSPSKIKKDINRRGGFGVNGFYLPMNDSSNPGADFHCAPNSIIKLKGEDLPQPRNGAPETTDAYVSQLREEQGTLGFDGCVHFDGTDDYLTVPGNAGFAFGTGDFTIEAFCYRSGGFFAIFDHQMGTGNFTIFSYSNGPIQIYNNQFLSSGVNPGNKRWFHLAVVRQSGTLSFYIDGVKASTTHTFNLNFTDASVNIGSSNYGERCRGFVSNLRVIKGTALYTSNFTPPTEPLTNITNTTLLCCNSVSSPTAATVTPGTITNNGGVVSGKNEIVTSLVLAVPGISTATSGNLVTNGTFDSGITGWSNWNATLSYDTATFGSSIKIADNGAQSRAYQVITTEVGKRYTAVADVKATGGNSLYDGMLLYTSVTDATTNASGSNGFANSIAGTDDIEFTARISFTATTTTTVVAFTQYGSSGVTYVKNVIVKQEDVPRDYSADIKGSGTNKTLTANGNSGVGYELGNYYGSAIQAGGAATNYLSFADSSDFDIGLNNQPFTWETWFNLTTTSTNTSLGLCRGGGAAGWNATSGHQYTAFYYSITNQLYFQYWTGSSFVSLTSPASIVTTNQWNHFSVVYDTKSNLTMYLNGVAVGNITSTTFGKPSASNITLIGLSSALDAAAAGYQQDVRVYKGLVKYKGGFDVPKPYTPVGIEEFRTTADTCKNNFATWNVLTSTPTNAHTLSNGNLTITQSGIWRSILGTHGVSSGKWYYEMKTVNDAHYLYLGWADGTHLMNTYPSSYNSGAAMRIDEGKAYHDQTGTNEIVNLGATMNHNDIVGVAFDADNGRIWWSKNGSWLQGNPATGASPVFDSQIPAGETYFPIAGTYDESAHANFGQNPTFCGSVTAGTNADDSGKGLFKYAPPSGFLALCTDNLPTPAIADPGKHFKTVIYTGSGGSKAITGVGFKPDLVWVKSRTNNEGHILFDSVRGPNVRQLVHTNTVEATATGGLNSFDDDGYSTGVYTGTNQSGQDYAAWCWKAGGAAVSNSDGSITSQVSVNQDAGFSIVSYTGNYTAGATIGHGLGKKPSFMIVKERTGSSGWFVYHKSLGATKFLSLHDTTAAGTETGNTSCWYATEPNTSVFTVGQNGAVNENNRPIIAYCWTEIEGFSKFGSYVANDDPDGPFVYCGFKPAWVLVKNISTTGTNWQLIDSVRSSSNGNNAYLIPNDPGQEYSTEAMDLLSNGFKLRTTSSGWNNASGNTYIFAAFAESPFQTANAK